MLERDPAQAAAADDDGIFHLWPEHEPALALWVAVWTQWRHGFNGRTGLDYAGVRASPAFRRMGRREADRVFDDLCVMERAALDAWAEDRGHASR